MVTMRIPGFQKRIVSAKHVGDIQIFADFGNTAQDNESVLELGPFEDTLIDQVPTSGGPPSRQQLMFGGITNTLWGTDAWFTGADLPNLNVLGQNAGVFRRRRRVIVKDVPEHSSTV